MARGVQPCSRKARGAAESERGPGHLVEARKGRDAVQAVTGKVLGPDHTRPPRLGEEFVFYSKGNGKLLKGSKQVADAISVLKGQLVPEAG